MVRELRLIALELRVVWEGVRGAVGAYFNVGLRGSRIVSCECV